MNIVNIGTDKSLVGGKSSGDSIERHKLYGTALDHLDIIVYTSRRDKLSTFAMAPNVTGHPTNSLTKLQFVRDAMRIFERIHRAHTVDLIVCQDPFVPALVGVKLKQRYGVKLQINFHGDFFDNSYWLREHLKHRFYLRLAEKNIKQADSIRVVSGAIKEKLIKRGIQPYNIFVIPTPVDLDKFKTEPTQTVAKTVLTVGRIDASKDLATFITAAQLVNQRLPETTFKIIGRGPLEKKFRAATKNLPFIIWTGYVGHDVLPEQYRQAAFFCLTSTNESFGKVLLEAAMSRVPAVATSTTGAAEIIENGVSGYLAPIGDAARIAERLVYLLQNNSVREQMGQNAFRIVSTKYGFPKSIDAMVAMWRQTVGKR